jgi:hypothetical protein
MNGFENPHPRSCSFRSGSPGAGSSYDHITTAVPGFSHELACDRLVVSNAALVLLDLAAADRPLLVIIDDLQWMDPASARVLGFVARRLSGSRVGFLAAERTGVPGTVNLNMPRYDVLPLDAEASMRVVAARFPELSPGVRQRIVAEAQGNAVALLELPTALSDPQRAALAALPAVLPLNPRLRAQFTSQICELPASTGYLLLLAVLEGTGNLSLLRAAAAGQWEMADLAPAEQAGLVRVDQHTGKVVFRHPLLRSAVVELSAGNDVRRAHQALAAQLSDEPERLVWHLAGAAIEPDGEVASLLEQAAHQAQRRGAVTHAVTALMRAAQLSPHDGERSRLLAEAACLSATVTGELPLVPRLLAEARRAALEPGAPLGPEESLHATIAQACLMLNGTDDIDSVHRLLRRDQGMAGEVADRQHGAIRRAPAAAHDVCGRRAAGTAGGLRRHCGRSRSGRPR